MSGNCLGKLKFPYNFLTISRSRKVVLARSESSSTPTKLSNFRPRTDSRERSSAISKDLKMGKRVSISRERIEKGLLGAYRYKAIDPTLTHDLASPTKPWALSPLISTMLHFAHTRLVSLTDNLDTPACSPVDSDVPEFPSNQSLTNDTSPLHLAIVSPTSLSSSIPDSPPSSAFSSSSSLSFLSSRKQQQQQSIPLNKDALTVVAVHIRPNLKFFGKLKTKTQKLQTSFKRDVC
ncbi:hypothetical protein K435DRAFT_880506 [Dendrothele bispora CBS 962.96]|uniref:Domain of unknown function at the cortex 1 domain-containing protein n=1 Tax=Dendrothele bispora (strain CBS 962.96) TaxID=1314807 RepID=A0A4S8KJB8_DENBC|nr:hypothetical protein K435DRAFT_880506 [Dendrothele bispora CBS 962.96]